MKKYRLIIWLCFAIVGLFAMDFLINGAPIRSLIMGKDQKRYQACEKPKSRAILRILTQTGIPFNSPNAGLSEAQIIDQINQHLSLINLVELGQNIPTNPEIFQLDFSDSRIKVTDYSKQHKYYLFSYEAFIPIALCQTSFEKSIGGININLPLYPDSKIKVPAEVEIYKEAKS